MKFIDVSSNTSYKKWVCGNYTIHQFQYTYDGSYNNIIKKVGYWSYYSPTGKRIEGNNKLYKSFDTLEDAIKACEDYERNKK